MSSETRLVRPFSGGEEFQRMLDACSLRCGDRVVEGGTELPVTLDEYLNHPFNLVFDAADTASAEAGAKALDLDLADIDLLVLAIAPRLKLVDEVYREALGTLAELPTTLPLTGSDRPRALRAPHGGADVRVYFCLNRTLPRRALTPWRKGTWLGRQEFRVRSEVTGTGFVPIRLTDDDRERLGLTQDTARFATLDDGDPFDPDPPADSVKLYVDGELLDRLALSAGTSIGRYVQRQLFLDAVSTIVFAVQQRLREDPMLGDQHIDDFRGSLVHRLTEIVAGKRMDSVTQDRRQREFAGIRDDPAAFIARVEAKTGMRKDLLESLGEFR